MSLNSDNSDIYNIFDFLNEHTVPKGQTYTHTSMYDPAKTYFIKSNELETFFQLYENEILKGKELHITEKREEIGPIVIDLDFKYELDTHERKHKKGHLKKIIDLYVNEILKLFEIESTDDKRLVSFVFERDQIYKPSKGVGIKKDGIHILFPFINAYPVAIHQIRDNILKKIGDVIFDLGLKNAIPDIVDRSVILANTAWLLYGSNKQEPRGNPYKLKYIFNGKSEEVSMEDYFGNSNINLAQFFSIRNRKESDLTPIRPDKQASLEVASKKKSVAKKASIRTNYNIEEIRELVSILNDYRAENYTDWIEVGWLLHNIDPNSDELLDIWIEFSKKSNKFKEGECEKIWDASKNEGLTIATLHYWARIDNPQKYNEIKKKDMTPLINMSIKNQTNVDVARVLFKMDEYNFVYCHGEWYTYKNHKWHRESDGMTLRKKISNELEKIYYQIMTDYNVLATSINTPEAEREDYKKKAYEVLELTKKLKTTSFKENVMKECRDEYVNNDFTKKLDTNPYLLGFTNGVYDLKKGELRDGRPDDYIEMSTNIEKIEFYEDHEHYESLKSFIETVFFDPEMRTYFLTYFSSCLQGHNAEEKFRIWTGIGCHAYDTEIMMFDGTTKKVQDIIIGDKIMGDDSTERNVLELKRGFSDMYEFTMRNGEKFTVNGDHILCLKMNDVSKSDVIEIKVRDYLSIYEKGFDKYFLYKNSVDFKEKDLPLDPYQIGYSLELTDEYIINSKEIRLKMLKGIIDRTGYYDNRAHKYEITLKNEKLINNTLYIARSLGYSASKSSFGVTLYEDDLKIKNSSYYGFTIQKVEDNNFYGFELDNNHRYLMGDFTVTHNSNGKSKILELFVHSLGDYAIKFPITMLTGKRAQSNACTPEIVQSKGKRFGYFEEPSENERINAGLLKEFTGGDKIKARGLHKDPIEFKPQFKLALLCNEMPEVPPNDSGTWRRMEVIEFKSRFCENPKESHEFPIDKYLSEKLKNWKELFMAFLLDKYYENYKKEGIKVPQEVIKYTLEYQKQCDLYTDFITNNIDDTKDMKDIVDINQVYEEFKVWYEDVFGHHKYPSKNDVKKYFKKKYGTKRVDRNEIKGIRFKLKVENKDLIPKEEPKTIEPLMKEQEQEEPVIEDIEEDVPELEPIDTNIVMEEEIIESDIEEKVVQVEEKSEVQTMAGY